MSHLPSKASVANALTGVCAAWRSAILSEEAYLRGVDFKVNVNQPFKGLAPVKGAVAHKRTWGGREHPFEAHGDGGGRREDDCGALGQKVLKAGAIGMGIPKILSRAAESNNVSALETLGMLKELQGDHSRAFRAFKKAATLGSPLAQFKLGEIFYRGLGNQGVDGEEALFWLTKATRDPSLDPDLLATAAGIMGFLHLDGEGTKPCNVSAVKWFKVAAENGNVEADKVLGWLYNTGQY